ncbi:hypothetical protein D3C85_1465090 [compost metagenome]
MADITACSGKDESFVCPFKEDCYRFTCIKNPYRQSYFVEIPFDKEKVDCKYYWANSKVEL